MLQGWECSPKKIGKKRPQNHAGREKLGMGADPGVLIPSLPPQKSPRERFLRSEIPDIWEFVG